MGLGSGKKTYSGSRGQKGTGSRIRNTEQHRGWIEQILCEKLNLTQGWAECPSGAPTVHILNRCGLIWTFLSVPITHRRGNLIFIRPCHYVYLQKRRASFFLSANGIYEISSAQAQSTYFTVRGQSYFCRLSKYWPPIPLSARPLLWGGGQTRRAERGMRGQYFGRREK